MQYRPIGYRIAAAVAALAMAACAGAPARALEPRELAGWWLAIDATFPTLVGAEIIVPMEELLIVHTDGTVENRMLGFQFADAALCAETGGFCNTRRWWRAGD